MKADDRRCVGLRLAPLAATLIAATLQVGCGIGEHPGLHVFDTESEEVIEGKLYGKPTKYWTGSPAMISVCWENPSSTNVSLNDGTTISEATLRSHVQNAIETSWQRFGRVNLTGWGACADVGSANIRIQITSSGGGQATALGKDLNNKVNGVILNMRNFTFGATCKNNATTYKRCMTTLSVHEFGHALGFYHEEERPDSPPDDCAGGAPGGNISGGQYYGMYSADSIMSYCAYPYNSTEGSSQTKISHFDIAAIQRAYGRRISGQLLTPRGTCLAANAFNPGNPGAKPFLWDCDEALDDQEWRRNVTSRSIRINPSAAPGYDACIRSGTPTEIRDCDGTLSQTWNFLDFELRGWGGKCLDLANGNTANGTPVTLWECFSDLFSPVYNVNQRWNIVKSPASNGTVEIRYTANTNKCLTVSGGSAVNGAALVISTCNSSTAQRFSMGTTIRYTSGGTTKCLDAAGVNDSEYLGGQGGPGNGQPILLFTCSSGTVLNQRWNMSGQLKNDLGPCLSHATDSNGANTGSTTCVTPTNSQGSTIWDYYW